MNKCTAALIPFALGLLATACSTNSSQQQTGVGSTASLESSQVQSETLSDLNSALQSKNQEIAQLQQQLNDNTAQLTELHKALDEKDQRIAALEKANINAETLAELELEKGRRLELEAEYAQLKVENASLADRIAALEQEKTQSIVTAVPLANQQAEQSLVATDSNAEFLALNKNFQTLDSAHYALGQKYQTLLTENSLLERKYANLQAENQHNQERLTELQAENLTLGGALSDARAQHQLLWDEIKTLKASNNSGLVTAKNDTSQVQAPQPPSVNESPVQTSSQTESELSLQLEQSQLRESTLSQQLDALTRHTKDLERSIIAYENELQLVNTELSENEQAASERLQALGEQHDQLSQAQLALQEELIEANQRLVTSQTELSELAEHLKMVEQALQTQQNESISLVAAMDAFDTQLKAELTPLQWQLPNEMVLHNTFEVVVATQVEGGVSGQTYTAQLITDSAINLISSASVDSVVQDGKLQWRWRLSGLNEKPDANLHLLVNQQMSYQNQKVSRQVLNESRSLALTNDNLLDKYGYWAAAILAGLLGGFLVGRINKRKN